MRNNKGNELVVAWNAGAGNDRISVDISFRQRRIPRKSETVELIFDIDGKVFEWDVPDKDDLRFSIEGTTWRDINALKLMLDSMRDGDDLKIALPTLGLSANFTLEGAFDSLEESLAVGEPRAH